MNFLVINFFILFVIVLFSFTSFSSKFEKDVYGYRLFNIVSDSMDPEIKKGSISLVRTSLDYEVSDVFVFKYPLNMTKSVIHRIVEKNGSDGTFVTKGDANSENDPWLVTSETIVGKSIFAIPLLGYVVSAIQKPEGLILFVLVPLSVIVFKEVNATKEDLEETIMKFSHQKRFWAYKLNNWKLKLQINVLKQKRPQL